MTDDKRISVSIEHKKGAGMSSMALDVNDKLNSENEKLNSELNKEVWEEFKGIKPETGNGFQKLIFDMLNKARQQGRDEEVRRFNMFLASCNPSSAIYLNGRKVFIIEVDVLHNRLREEANKV